MHGIETIKQLNSLQEQNSNVSNELTKAEAHHKDRKSPSEIAQDEALEGIKNA